ncbi:hypothetical protein M0804_000460 [Polistes exclamans]|nr:hypothetical protein M0804_000460 [Polistes exclamans]
MTETINSAEGIVVVMLLPQDLVWNRSKCKLSATRLNLTGYGLDLKQQWVLSCSNQSNFHCCTDGPSS